jgi:hypothetical protein
MQEQNPLWQVAVNPPPIPHWMVGKITHNDHRWHPTNKDMTNLLQMYKRQERLDPNDTKSTYEMLHLMSGLDSGVNRSYNPSLATNISALGSTPVLYWQEQECHCNQEVVVPGLKTKLTCSNANGQCKPFIAILQVRS